MWTRLWLTALLIVGGWAFYSPPVHASCEVQTVPRTYANGFFIGGDLCDASGNKKVTSGTTPTGTGSATAAAPTLAEASQGYFSWDLAGNLRVTLGTLISGEDQTNNLLMTSGGAVRSTPMGTAMVVGGDGTPKAAVSLKVGMKTIHGTVDGTGAITQTQKIYGGITSGVTATNGELLCTLTLSGTTHAHASCVTESPWLFYIVVTSATTGTGATGVVTGMQ